MRKKTPCVIILVILISSLYVKLFHALDSIYDKKLETFFSGVLCIITYIFYSQLIEIEKQANKILLFKKRLSLYNKLYSIMECYLMKSSEYHSGEHIKEIKGETYREIQFLFGADVTNSVKFLFEHIKKVIERDEIDNKERNKEQPSCKILSKNSEDNLSDADKMESFEKEFNKIFEKYIKLSDIK